MKNCVYILISEKDHKKYIGSTNDLERRLLEHNEGRVKSTKSRKPLILFGFREFNDIKEATFYEKKYKKSHDCLKKDIESGKLILV